MALKNLFGGFMKKKNEGFTVDSKIKTDSFSTHKHPSKSLPMSQQLRFTRLERLIKFLWKNEDSNTTFMGQLFYSGNKKRCAVRFLVITERIFGIYSTVFHERTEEQIMETKVALEKERERHQKRASLGIQMMPLKIPPTQIIKTELSEDYTLKQLFEIMLKEKASDLHIITGLPPKFRIKGNLAELDTPPITKEKSWELISDILTKKQIEIFNKELDLDFTYEESELARFRSNIMKEQKGCGAVFRIIPPDIPGMEELGIPPIVKEIAGYKQGLIIVTGPTGSGKTTTMASLIDYINRTRSANILTVESPLEFIHKNKKSQINYREVGMHTPTFADAVRAAKREDLDVIMVGEMADKDTILEAIQTADMGNLVLGVMNITGVARTIERIIEVFPGSLQGQVRSMLSGSLRAIIAQQLIPTMDGSGRCAVVEVAIASQSLTNMIREGKTTMINSVIHSSRDIGMQSLDLALLKLVKESKIDEESARLRSSSPRSFTVPAEFKPQKKADFSQL